MTHQFLKDVLRLVEWLVLLLAIFVPLEHAFAVRPAKVFRKQFGVDLAWYFINSLIPAAVMAVPLALIYQVVRGLAPGYYAASASWPLWLRMTLIVFVNDIGAYWGHRIMHSHRALWRFHAVHHSAEHVDWLVNTRSHPFDILFVHFMGLALVYISGLAQSSTSGIDKAVAGLAIFGTIWTFFIHANIRVRLGPVEWLISSPAFHHWHHTNDEHRDRNFAFVFPFIDKIFGTAWLPKYWPPSYGIDAQMPDTISGQFFEPMEPSKTKRVQKVTAD